MYTALVILQIVVAIALVALVLLQHGKGADAGAAFGSGASATVFGARGSASFLTRATAVLATVFFLNSLALSTPLVVGRSHAPTSVTQQAPAGVPAAGGGAPTSKTAPKGAAAPPKTSPTPAKKQPSEPPDVPTAPSGSGTTDLPPG